MAKNNLIVQSLIQKLFKGGGLLKPSTELPEKQESHKLGNGNGAFLSDFTEADYQQYLRDERDGWKKFQKALGIK